MSRIKNKGKFFKVNLKNNKKINKIYNKSLTILPEYVNNFFSIYNGKAFINLKITNNMIGYKFGEFIYTKKKFFYKKKIKDGSKNNTNKFKIK
jgi:small subunit ribosomal protein S19